MTEEETGSRAVIRERLRGALEDTEETNNGRNEQFDVDTLSKNEHVALLRELSLKTTSNQPELRARLKAASELDGSGSEDQNEGRNDNECHFTDSELSNREVAAAARARHSRNVPHPTLTYKDVEDALETFSGDGTQNLKRWLTNFEETAELCSWTDVQKVIYAKRLLKESAKLFVSFECNVKSWGHLKLALAEEFSTATYSKQSHRELSSAKKKPNETFQEYIYHVLEIASHADIELEARIQYIIDGVPDSEANKSILYGALTIKELRKKFSHYEAQISRIKTQANNSKQKQTGYGKSNSGPQSTDENQGKRCYNCGDKRYLGKDCPNKTKGTKCFSCGEYGHVAPICPKNPKKPNSSNLKEQSKSRCDAVATGDRKTYKIVSVNGKEIEAVIDSGNDLHFMRSSCYVRLGAPFLRDNSISFGVVGAFESRTLGSFDSHVIIDKMPIEIQIHVIPDHAIDHDLLIGRESLLCRAGRDRFKDASRPR